MTRWLRVPVPERLNPWNVHEHTPLYCYKEYPRFIRPVGAHAAPQWKWKLVKEPK
jgi:hypothetical protein